MYDPDRLLERIVLDPEIMVGKPVVRGTRVPVALVLKRLAQTLDPDAIIEAHPRLTRDDIRACVLYAQGIVENEDVFPYPAGPVPSRVPD